MEINKYLHQTSCTSFQIQSFIDKEFEFQLIGLSIGDTILIPGVTKLLWNSNYSSNTGVVEYIPNYNLISTGLIDKVKNFVRATEYQGPFSVEFLKGKDGKEYFMEMNFRNDGNSIVMTKAGINYHQIWYNYNNRIPYEYLLNDKTKHTIAIPFFSMLSPAKKQHKILKLIKYSISPNRIFMDIDFKDVKPFNGFIKRIIRNKLKNK